MMTVLDYFGVCPICGRTDGYLNVHKAHFGICHQHRLRWSIGWNLMSSWQYESEDTWRENEETLAGYTPVTPAFTNVELLFARLRLRPLYDAWRRARYRFYVWRHKPLFARPAAAVAIAHDDEIPF